ncbi:MAG: FkbM family methyltransferase [Henriciella sp.]
MPNFTDEEKLSYIAAHQTDGRLFEDIITCMYRNICGEGDHVIDAGANHGHHTFQLSNLVGPTGQVVAVEPIPALADAIDETMRKYVLTNIDLVVSALSDRRGIAEFFFRRDMDGWSSLFSRHVPPKTDARNISRFFTPLILLDDLMDIVTDTKFIKLDLELNEYHAICGALKLLERDKPFLVFENARQHAANIAGYSRQDFFGLFDKAGYALFDIFLDPFTEDRWQGDPTMPVYNVAVPQSTIGDLHSLPIRDFFSSSMVR